MAEETRAPIYIPSYKLGDEGKPSHFAASTSREAAAEEAKSLDVGDAAFIKRSDLKWTYAVVTEKVEGEATILRFEVDKDRNRKSFPQAQWGKYIRVIKVDEEEMAKLKEEAEPKVEEVPKEEEAKSAAEEAKPAEGAPKEEQAKPAEEAPKDDEANSKEASKDGEAKRAEAVKEEEKSIGGDSKASKASKTSKGGTWFSGFGGGIFSTSSKKEEKASEDKPAVSEAPKAEEEPKAEKPAPAAAEDGPAAPPPAREPTQEGSVASAEPMTEDPAAAALAATSFPKDEPKEEAVATLIPSAEAAPESAPEPNNTKENSDPKELTCPPVFLPSPKSGDDASKTLAQSTATEPATPSSSSLRNPLNLKPTLSLKKKNSLLNKVFKKDKTPPKTTEKKVLVQSPKDKAANTTAQLGGPIPKSPKEAENKKEWFDPDACEVDYDKNPTDLFQALEARQFSYADEMFKQVNRQFTKECHTWVVARGQKKKDSAQLRFRALPLHAALVFGAPDDMIKKILNSYPKATRGRDVKGRLPIHLAMEHNASEEIVCLILEAFPKGFYARDKKDMVPLDYVNGNMMRCHMKKYIPLITEARVEEERAKWEQEMEEALEAQKVALKGDAEYMKDVVATVTDDVEMAYATKMELLESNYQKEILLLKKKHDSETQALLEGFEVKLNFERKLQKLKGKA